LLGGNPNIKRKKKEQRQRKGKRRGMLEGPTGKVGWVGGKNRKEMHLKKTRRPKPLGVY